MDETQRNILRDCHVDLVRDLEPKFVLDLLYQDGILTDNDLEIIQAEKSARGRCQILLSVLPTRGPTAYGSFQRALRETNYSHLGAILDKTEKRQILKNGNSASKTFLSGDTISDNNRSNINTASICGVCKNFLETKLKPRINDSVLQGIFRKHCCLFTHNIEPRELIDEFYQQLLLDGDQYERVRTAVTRRDRCEIFFAEVITSNSDHVLAVLTKSLEKKYMYIVKEIHRTIGSEENVTSLRNDLHVLTKLANDDTVVKAVDNENVFQDETVEANRSGRQEDVPKDVTMHGHGLPDRFMDYSSIGKNMNATEDKENNGDDDLETTRQKVIAHSDNFEMPVSKWDGGYVDVHPMEYDTPKKNNMVNASCTSGQCIEKNDGKLDNFSKLITKELATRTKTCSKCLDKPDGMFMKKSHFNNYYDEAKCSKSYTQSTTDIAENKNCKIKQHQVSEREISENRKKKYSMTKTNGKTKPTTTGMNSSVTKSDTIDNDVSDVVKDKFQISRLGASCPVEPSKRLTFAFNHLSTLINEGNFEKFDILSQRLQDKFPSDYDMLCIVGYLKTSRDLFLTNFDSAKQKINSTLELVPKTSNPRYFTLELFTAKTRMYITHKKLEKLQSTLDDAMMILETDPVGCTGRAAGWLYINDARNQTAKLSVLNLSKPNALKIYEQFYERAKTSFKRSMTNFKNDGGKDGPFGFGYALCRLVILLLRCGDNGMAMNSLTPLREDVDAAEQYLKNLEDSEIVMAKILEMHFRLAKCDYYFRRENNVRALEHAEAAYNLASDLKLLEFTEHAQNRLKFLQSRTKLKVIELDDDEVNNILFGESTETVSSQSDY